MSNITNRQIATLQDEAAAAGNHDQVAICEIALGTSTPYPTEQEQQDAREQCAEALSIAYASAPETLYDYRTATPLRTATFEEHQASTEAAEHDGGSGAITVADHDAPCYTA